VGTPILKVRPAKPGERLTPTIVLQRGEPVIKRKQKRPAASEPGKAAAPRTQSARSVVGMSAVSTAEGSSLVTNEALAARFPNRTAEEILQLTGIETRRHLAEGETVLELATTAASKALKAEGLTVSDLDAILVSTTTPVEVTPSMACALQARLCPNDEPTHLVAYDILAACSGFLYALSAAFNLLQTRPTAKVMVVTAEALSKVVNRDNFDTAILFGDAATAVILYGPANLHHAKMLVHSPVVGAKPDPDRILHVPNPGSGFVEMEGR